MANNNKFFTNTYVTSSGRQNYLRIDHLEDPLFTSFTFDIDYATSPLFYTINNSDYGYPNNVNIGGDIEVAIGQMLAEKLASDGGYDILPLMSAYFLDDRKLGFGLQQNVYTDLPLYGAAEYIYMVDKRNASGSQNDVAGGRSGEYVSNSGGSISFNSYKLGDSVKNAVSESDKAWAKEQNEQAEEQIAECDAIMNDPDVKKEHEANEKNMNNLKKACDDCKISVTGINGTFTEAELQQKVNELKGINDRFEQIKKDIASWVNGELTAWQNKITSIYNNNQCVKKLMSFSQADATYLSGTESSSPPKKEMIRIYGSDWVEKYIWKASDKKTYVWQCVELYNSYENYKKVPSGYQNKFVEDSDKGTSLLIEQTTNDNKVTVRPSRVQAKFKKELIALGLMEEGGSFNSEIKVNMSKNPPEWAILMPSRIEMVAKDTKTLINTAILGPLQYKCDSTCFDGLESKVYTENFDLLGRYESALENIRAELYGVSGDASNPSPDSKYGEYLSAKDIYENDAYSQAKKTKEILDNRSMKDPDESESSDINTQDSPTSEGDGTTSVTDIDIQQTNGDSINSKSVTAIAPQTVLDMLGFISGMKKMTINYPYIIHGITGLDKAYENHYGIKDPYLGSGDNKIVLSCWESLDLRVSSMFNRYFNAVYDRQYRRERVPINLRRFNCSVYVHDVRNFASNLQSEYENRLFELKGMYNSVIEFRFYDCEIVPEETGNIFDDISNETPSEMKKTNFTFTYGNCVVNFVPQS